ncbi:MAG: hypothetical protein HUK25_09515 [Treponema sp.]|nr:hypothetical protein [Clostridia bacterium]MCF0242866.1 hypothetical protein [Treponema sp.]
MKKVEYIAISLICCFFSACTSNKIMYYGIDKVNGWEDVRDFSGDLKILNSGKVELINCLNQNYIIEVKLQNKEKSYKANFLIDTGSIGNLICQRALTELDYGNKTPYRFLKARFYYASTPQPPHYKSIGVYFDKIVSDGFEMDKVLFQTYGAEYLTQTPDGRNIDGILGMEFLRKKPFLFSYKNNALTFFNDNTGFPKQGKELNKKKLPDRIEIEVTYPNGKTDWAYLDTGAKFSVINDKQYRKNKKNITTIVEDVREKITNSYFIFSEVSIGERRFENAPFYHTTYGNGYFFKTSNSTLGNYLLRNFELYIDVKTGIYVMKPNDIEIQQTSFMKFINNGREFDGIVISPSQNGKRYIDGVFRVNGKYVYENIHLGDEVLKINGLDVEKYIESGRGNTEKHKIFLLSRDGEEFIEEIFTKDFIGGPEI